MSNPRAAFIVIEGLDRSGKSTQAQILKERLESDHRRVELIKFPDRTTAIGKTIDSYLRSESELDNHAIHLLFSANRWEHATRITTLLQSGTTVLADRYAFSGIAFSAYKGLPYTWCRAPDIGLPAPDLTLFLDIEPAAASARGGYGAERYEREEVQRGVRGVFGTIGAEMSDGVGGSDGLGGSRWMEIDAGREMDEVAREIWDAVHPLLDKVGVRPVGRLWE
ncbi:thymidylate kinase-domain-containing protein, partial [Hygrophoropsis aurantiaca]